MGGGAAAVGMGGAGDFTLRPPEVVLCLGDDEGLAGSTGTVGLTVSFLESVTFSGVFLEEFPKTWPNLPVTESFGRCFFRAALLPNMVE